jgi:hypothetical protein
VLSLLLLSASADAARMPLDPQNRLHLGVAAMDGTESFGLTLGMDSRLTRFVSIDIGAFLSATESPVLVPPEDSTIEDWITMRHGIWFAPGIRVPHRYGDGLTWDVFVRGGFASVWSEDASDDYDSLFDVAMLGGLDFMLRKDHIGLRLSGKGFFYKSSPYVAWTQKWVASELFVFAPQVSLEAIYQF